MDRVINLCKDLRSYPNFGSFYVDETSIECLSCGMKVSRTFVMSWQSAHNIRSRNALIICKRGAVHGRELRKLPEDN
jgi:hypothetical protein